MIKLHPEFLTKNGKKEFAVLPYEEFIKIQELLEDLEDIEDLRKAKEEEQHSRYYSLSEVKQMLSQENTILDSLSDKIPIDEHKSDGKKMAEALRKIAKNNTLSKIDTQEWRKNIHQDRPITNND